MIHRFAHGQRMRINVCSSCDCSHRAAAHPRSSPAAAAMSRLPDPDPPLRHAADQQQQQVGSPGAVMHELQSDGEDDDTGAEREWEGEGEVEIDEDDLAEADEAAVAAVPVSASATAAAAAAASVVASSSAASALHALPSYKKLMASLGPRGRATTDSDEARAAAAAASLSLSPGSVGAANASAAGVQPYTHDADENRGFLQDDEPSSSVSGGGGLAESEPAVDDAVLSFEEMMSRAQKLESRGFLRKAAHYYLFCLEKFRYSHQHQTLVATCLARLGDICYKNKKC